MSDIVNEDDGTGGTSDNNNREYGGTVAENDAVIKNKPGPVSQPGVEAHINLRTASNSRSEFHSHPSGTSTDQDRTSTGSTSKVGGSTTNNSYQSDGPSKDDIKNVGDRTGYVFSMSNKTVFIYNNQGVTATLPMSKFAKYK